MSATATRASPTYLGQTAGSPSPGRITLEGRSFLQSSWFAYPDAASHSLSQHLEYDRRRPAEQQHAVHGRHRAKQPPALDRHDVAVAQRRIVDKGEVQGTPPSR